MFDRIASVLICLPGVLNLLRVEVRFYDRLFD
jgi:hypothetical protein